jgi:phage tail sheath protein FI
MSDLVHGIEVLEVDDGIRTITTVRSSVIGLVGTMPDADEAKLPLNTPVLVAGQRAAAALVDADVVDPDKGTIGEALAAIHSIASPVIVVVRIADPGEGNPLSAALVGDSVARTGIYALLNAKSVTGVVPRILIAPCVDGFTYGAQLDGAPAAAALAAVADRLKAVCIIDGPDTDTADANLAVQVIGSKRCYLVDPSVEYAGVQQPASPFVAGLIAKTDAEIGFWRSPSNQVITGITGTSRPIDYAAGDAACEADILNGFHCGTIIREGGYRLWGNFTTETVDSKWFFLPVVRIADMINESILANHLWAVDRNISATYLEEVIAGVEDYLRRLTAQGAIYGGSCWADPELNTVESIAAGNIYFDFDFTPVATANRVTFRSHLVNDFIEGLV